VWLFVRDGPHLTAASRFDPAAAIKAFRSRGTRIATLGYLGHMWELYAMWTWTAAFAAASLAASGTPGAQRLSSLLAALSIGAGAAGCIAAGVWADRIGKARVASGAMVTSGACVALTFLAFGAHPVILTALLIVWGFSVVADSAQFSALVTEHTPSEHVGTALTIQTCTGFLLTMASIQLTGWVAGEVGWKWAFLILLPGPVFGAWIMGIMPSAAGERGLRA
jgi:MFS family permease